MKSVGAMIKQLHGMLGTDDLTGWESEFIDSVFKQSGEAVDATYLSTNQIDTLQRIYTKHFGD